MRRLHIAVAVAAALAVPTAAWASAATQVTVPRGQPVQIAFADDLTGPASDLGAGAANAVQMAVEALRG